LKAQSNERTFNIVVEKDEDNYFVASVVELPGCHTQARSLDKLTERIREAIEAYIAVSKPGTSPEFVGVQQLKMKFR